MTARLCWVQRNTRGHRPRLQWLRQFLHILLCTLSRVSSGGGHLSRRSVVSSILCGLAVTVWVVTLPGAVSSAQEPITFTKDIQPIFQSSCWKCHGETLQLSKLDLRTL